MNNDETQKINVYRTHDVENSRNTGGGGGGGGTANSMTGTAPKQ